MHLKVMKILRIWLDKFCESYPWSFSNNDFYLQRTPNQTPIGRVECKGSILRRIGSNYSSDPSDPATFS